MAIAAGGAVGDPAGAAAGSAAASSAMGGGGALGNLTKDLISGRDGFKNLLSYQIHSI
ncbi:17093_t:CDS:2 [Funneliformis geosporum]|uniref:17093_t:CDS:1 n=1 Tax=Funneliformis geosporum TaxID=1117311 RepID=A0A9W4SAL5_9GLOM|nr:17093_t:CDS:2 [Funneliformis geosporum]